jgi:hypothetical protein
LRDIAGWLWTAWFVVGSRRASPIVEHRPHEGRLLQDLIAALFVNITYILNPPSRGLLLTSGVIAIILGAIVMPGEDMLERALRSGSSPSRRCPTRPTRIGIRPCALLYGLALQLRFPARYNVKLNGTTA